MQLTLPVKKWKERVPIKNFGKWKKPKWKKPKKKTVMIIIGVVLLVAAVLATWLLLFQEDEQVALTETLTTGSLATTITGTGVTVPTDSETITVASTAVINKVYVSAGDTVEVGDMLYEQDDSELDDEIADYEDEIADLEDTLADYQSQVSDLNETISDLTTTAPFSGNISEINVEVGDNVSSGTTLAVLVDNSELTLTQYFSYAYEDDIYVGMKANVSVASLMLNLEGTVTDIEKVDRVTTEGTRCFAVIITVENPGALTEGMSGAGYLLTDSGEKLYPAIEGELEYKNTKTLTAEASGEISAVNVVDYETVTSGQLLFEIDDTDYLEDLSSLNDRISQTEERISNYEDKIEETEESREDYAVQAEIAGKVILVGIREGEEPRSSSTTAVMIYNLDTMEITADIDELDIDSIEKGMDVTVTKSGTNSSEDQVYDATISEVSYEATNSDGVAYFPITIEIPAEGELSAGINVSYTIQIGDESEGVLAPISALKTTSEGTCLFIESDTRPDDAIDLDGVDIPDGFYAVPVEIGVSNNEYVQIVSGASEGDVVFTRYQESAPSGGDTTSDSEESDDANTDNSFQGPGGDFSGGGPGGMGGGPMG
ncbi:MAG: efflux RND transporter periplasmic adaptor subunit [Oscillospiraceae bacterium]